MTSNILWEGTLYLMLISSVLGICISIITQIFYVKEDTRTEAIYNILPHFNCGACGYPGCMPYAEALTSGEDVPYTKCRPGKEAVAQKILAILQPESDNKQTSSNKTG